MKKVIIVNPINLGRDHLRPPFGLMLINSLFEREGVECVWVDADVIKDSFKIITKINENLDADLLITGGMHTAYPHIKSLFTDLKNDDINIPTLIGGRVASTLNHLIWNLFPQNVTMICTQEAENVIKSICDNFPKLENIKGIEFRRGDEIIKNPPAPLVTSLEEWPAFDWSLLSDEYYRTNTAFIMGSIGCPFRCTFCREIDGPRDRVRYMSAKKLIDEQIIPHYDRGIRLFVFVDEFFLLNKKTASAFCDELEKHKLNFAWRAQSRADNIGPKDAELLKRMKKLGLERLILGIESTSETVLKAMNKRTHVEQYETAINEIRKAGIAVTGLFIFGHPGETHQTATATAHWRVKMDLPGGYFYCAPFPGTELYKDFKKKWLPTHEDEEDFISQVPSIKEATLNLTDMSNGKWKATDQTCKQILMGAKEFKHRKPDG